VQKVVKPLADQIPPSSPPNITSHITTKQLPNTAPIAKGSTTQLPIRVISPNSIDYDSGKEDALGIRRPTALKTVHLLKCKERQNLYLLEFVCNFNPTPKTVKFEAQLLFICYRGPKMRKILA
jgi:hypothetical protein